VTAMKKVNKKTKAKINKQVRADIKKTVEKIPGLIFEHVRLQNQQEEMPATKSITIPQSQPEKKIMSYDYGDMQRKRKIMWSGVIILTAIVFAMWIVNAKLAFSDIKNGYVKPVQGITETAKKTWQETMGVSTTDKPVTTENNLDDLKKQIKNNLISILYVQQASTTASSTN